MSLKNVFKSTLPFNTFLFKNGKAAVFTHGRYETDNADEITQLTNEITLGIPYIYVDPADASIDTSLQDEIRDAQIQAMQDVIARRAKAAEAAATVVNTRSEVPFDSGSSVGTVDDQVNTGSGSDIGSGTNTGGTAISTDASSGASNPSNSVAAILAARSANAATSTSSAPGV